MNFLNFKLFFVFLTIFALTNAEVNLSCENNIQENTPNLNISVFISFKNPNLDVSK